MRRYSNAIPRDQRADFADSQSGNPGKRNRNPLGSSGDSFPAQKERKPFLLKRGEPLAVALEREDHRARLAAARELEDDDGALDAFLDDLGEFISPGLVCEDAQYE